MLALTWWAGLIATSPTDRTGRKSTMADAGGLPGKARSLRGFDGAGARHLELRQLRYFVTLAEELHFGRAAAREHIVQSALSQQIQRLERELGVLLLDRTTHHVQLSPAGSAFLIEARQILAQVDRAAV